MRIVIPTEGGHDSILIEGSRIELEMLAEGCAFAAESPEHSSEGQCLNPDGVVAITIQLVPCRPNFFRPESCNRGVQGCDVIHEGE